MDRLTAAVPDFARGPVLVVAAAVAVLLTAVSGRYGYFGDELYFIAAGHHLAWGYADQPPLLPLIALAMDTIAPGSVAVLRIPATIATVVGIVFAALLAREFGGGRRAQLVAAGALAVSPSFLATGHLLATSTLDPALWVILTWLLVRWVRTRADGLLLAAGVVTAVGLQVKFLLLAFWAVAIIAVLVFGPREMLRRPALWAGGAIAALATVPTVVWQAQNGWPQLGMGRAVAAESVYAGGMLGFLPLGVVVTGLLIGTVLVVHGLGTLLRDPDHRFLGVTALGVAAVFMVSGGRPYYIIGMFPLLWAASAARIERHRPAVWWRWVPTWPVYGLTAVVMLGVLNVLPIKPVSAFADQPLMIGNFQLDEIGWRETVPDVEAAFQALPPDVARNAVVVTGDYWSVSAVQFFAPELRSYSFSRGAAWFGVPPEDSGAVIFVGDPTAVAPMFDRVTQVGVLDNDVRVNNLSQGSPIFLLEGRQRPWVQIWAQVRRLQPVRGYECWGTRIQARPRAQAAVRSAPFLPDSGTSSYRLAGTWRTVTQTLTCFGCVSVHVCHYGSPCYPDSDLPMRHSGHAPGLSHRPVDDRQGDTSLTTLQTTRPTTGVEHRPWTAQDFPPPRFPSGVGVGPATLLGVLLIGAVCLLALPPTGTTAAGAWTASGWAASGWAARPGLLPGASLAVLAVAVFLTVRVAVVLPVRRLRDDLARAVAERAPRMVHRSSIAELDAVAVELRERSALRCGAAGRRLPLVAGLAVAAVMVLAWTVAAGMAIAVRSDPTAAGVAATHGRTTLDASVGGLRSALDDGLATVREASAPGTGQTIADPATTAAAVHNGQHLFRSVSVLDLAGRPVATAGPPSPAGIGLPPPRPVIEQVNSSGSSPVVVASAPMWDGRHFLVGEFDPRTLNDLLRRSGVHTRVLDGGMRTILDTVGYQAFAEVRDPAVRAAAEAAGSGAATPDVRQAGGSQVAAGALAGSDLDWVLVQDQDVAAAAFAGDPVRRTATVVVAAGAGLALALLLWTYATVVRPVRRMAGHVTGPAGGALAPQRLDEIGAAVVALNRLRGPR